MGLQMIKKIIPMLLVAIVFGSVGAYFGKEKIVNKEKREEIRTIVETRPDGTKIVTREKIRHNTKTVTIKVPMRKYHIRLKTGLLRPSIEEIGLGYALTRSVSLEASYAPQTTTTGLSVIVRF